jgi:hypothetical protein
MITHHVAPVWTRQCPSLLGHHQDERDSPPITPESNEAAGMSHLRRSDSFCSLPTLSASRALAFSVRKHLAISHWQLALCFRTTGGPGLPRSSSGADPSPLAPQTRKTGALWGPRLGLTKKARPRDSGWHAERDRCCWNQMQGR